jgi:hypothetical protein
MPMNKPDPSSSGSAAGAVVLIAVLLLAVPCLAGVALLGAGYWFARSVPAAAPPVVVAPVPEVAPPIEAAPPPAIEPASPPLEPQTERAKAAGETAADDAGTEPPSSGP